MIQLVQSMQSWKGIKNYKWKGKNTNKLQFNLDLIMFRSFFKQMGHKWICDTLSILKRKIVQKTGGVNSYTVEAENSQDRYTNTTRFN